MGILNILDTLHYVTGQHQGFSRQVNSQLRRRHSGQRTNAHELREQRAARGGPGSAVKMLSRKRAETERKKSRTLPTTSSANW